MIDTAPRLMVKDVEVAATLQVESIRDGVFALTIFERLGGSDNWPAKGQVDVDASALAAIATFTGAVPSDATLLALPCEQQHRLAKLLAENVGYVLAEEPEHPDSPHRASTGAERSVIGKTFPETGNKLHQENEARTSESLPAPAAQMGGAVEFDSEGIPYAAGDDPRIEPLKVAIEGECDGLMIANESARTILGQMDHEMILSGAVPPAAERFFLSTDNDSHWYFVPVDKAAEWEAWAAIPEDDERAWEAPEFATPLGGAPCLVTFAAPHLNTRPLPTHPAGED